MNTEVLHLRARASRAADHAALRQLATGWLGRLQPQDHGLPHDAIVLLRKLHVQGGAGPGPRGQTWRRVADEAWAHTLAGAARLVPGQAVPAAATAVWFAGPVELLVNLLHDLARGTLGHGWWWPLALRRGSVAGALADGAWHHLQRHARQLPMAMLQLPLAQAHAAWATGSHTQQQALVQALVQHFGLHVGWFGPLPAQAPVVQGDCSAAAGNWVDLCRQIAIDPTPLRRAPAAHAAYGAELRHAPFDEERTADDEPADSERLRPAADETAAQPVAAAEGAWPGGQHAPRRVRVSHAASGNADERITDGPKAIGAGLELRLEPDSRARQEDAGHGAWHEAWQEAWPMHTAASTPGAPPTHGPSDADRSWTPVPTPSKPIHADAVHWRQLPAVNHLHSRYAGLLLLLNAALAMGLYGDFSQPRLPGLPLHPWRWLWLAGRHLHGAALADDPLARWLQGAGGPHSSPAPACAAWRPDAKTLEPWSEDTRPWTLLHRPDQAAVVLLHPAGFTVARLASADELPALWRQLERPPPSLLWRLRPRARAPLHAVHDPLHDLWPCLWARLALALKDLAALTARAKALARWATTQAGRVEISSTRVRAVYALGKWPLALRLAGLDRNPGWIPAAGCELVFDFE